MHFAQQLATRRVQLTVLTNSPSIAKCLADVGGITHILLGGQMRRKTGGISGPLALEIIERFRLRLHYVVAAGWQLMLSAYSKNKDAAGKLIKYLVSYETQKDHAIKLSRLPTRPAVYEDKDVLAAQPWFSRLLPVFQNAVARPSTVTGTDYNKVSTSFFQTTNKILNGEISVDEGVQSLESRIKRDLR